MISLQKFVYNVLMELLQMHKISVNAFLVQNKDLYITNKSKLVNHVLLNQLLTLLQKVNVLLAQKIRQGIIYQIIIVKNVLKDFM